MSNELPRPVIAIAVVLLVLVIGFLFVKANKPAYYKASPAMSANQANPEPSQSDYAKHEFAPDGRRELPPQGVLPGDFKKPVDAQPQQ